MTHHGLLRGVILLFTSPDRRVQHFPPGCVLEMGLDTAIPYHYTQTRGEIQHVLKIFFGVLGDYLKTFGLCPRLKPPLPPAHNHPSRAAFPSTHRAYFIHQVHFKYLVLSLPS